MSIEQLTPFLAPKYENFPQGRTIGLVVLRTTQSETIFRTEGTGEPMCAEYVQAGRDRVETIPRLVMTKRKQVAPERRRGREFLRQHNLLRTAPKTDEICAMNTNAPCEMCIDCFLYGFAAGGEGAQKSRVWTEDAFSVLPSTELIADRTINAIFETGTMRDEKGNASTALNTSEYIKPGTHFLDIVTLKDVTADELRYAIGNILLTTRYGAVSSRVGRMDNQILSVFGGSAELPSSLELVQELYDHLANSEITTLEHPLKLDPMLDAIASILGTWKGKRGIDIQLSGADLDALIADVDRHWSIKEREAFLQRLDASYEEQRQVKPESKKKDKGGRDKKLSES